MKKIKTIFSEQKNQLSLPLMIFVYLSRAVFLISCFTVSSPKEAVYPLISFFLTYLISFCHLISKEGSFLHSLSHRTTVLICASSLVSCFIGQTLGVLEKIPDYDIVMSAVTGVMSTLFGYYITLALKDITNKRDCGFVSSSAFFISGTIVLFRELIEFFCDFFFGTNFSHVEQIGDDHWFFRLFGIGKGVPQQRPLYDTDEDILISLVFSAIATAFIYIFLRSRNKNLYIKEKRKAFSLKALPERISDKIFIEIDKAKADTNIWDILIWWITRSSMLYAIISMDVVAEQILMAANLLGTFAITLMHLIFKPDSLFCKINYRVQSWVCLIVFTGSYMGHYTFVYNHLPRFDLFLHFVSGFITVAAGYYAARTFMKPGSKHNILLICVYAFCISGFIMPFWEVFEFVGDFLFGSANQGFYWAPSDSSFFFKVFGHGVGNTSLYYLYDTIYDVLLALLTTVISTVWLYISLLLNLRKENDCKSEAAEKITAEAAEKITADC